MQTPLSFLFRLFLLLSLGVGALAADRKDKKDALPSPPPQPVQQTLKVKRGEKVTIPLRIYGTQREVVRFLIRKEPAAGKLTEPQVRDRESALVTYQSPADLAVVRDQFSYAAQTSAGVSAAADVVITIVDEPPMLGLPDTVEFDPILTGSTSVREIEIANRGGGLAAGEISVDAPWRVEEPAEYRLAAGEQRTVKLTFAPVTAGTFRTEVRFSSDRSRTVALRGEAQAALSAAPAVLELSALPGETVRQGAFDLVNGTAEPQEVTLSGPARLAFPKTVALGPHGKVPVLIATAPGEVEALREEIQAKGAGVQVQIPVNGKVLGPVLRLVGEKLDFSKSAAAQIQVENAGGAPGYWRWDVIPPFAPAESGFQLAAGERKTLTMQVDGSAAAELRAMLKIIGEQQTLQVPAERSGAAPAQSAVRSEPAPRRTAARQESPSSAPERTSIRRASAEEPAQNDGPGVMPLKVEVEKVEEKRAVFAWPSGGRGANRFTVEIRYLSLDAGKNLKMEWKPVSEAQLRAEGNRVIADVQPLVPDNLYTFRVVPLEENGERAPSIGTVQFRTPASEPLVKVTQSRLLWLAALGLLGGIFWYRRQQR